MNVVFLGSGRLACPVLSALLASRTCRVAGVVTQPDRPSGRNLRLSACPVREMIGGAGVPVLTPERIGAPEAVEAVRALRPDVLVTAAYGQFLTRALLSVPPVASVNVHPSLLPKYRGAAPIQWAIANGDERTGVTILHMTERMDAGDLILQEPMPIGPEDTAETLEPRLAEVGAALLIRALEALGSGTAPRIPQEESAVVFAPKLTREDGRVDWTRSAKSLCDRARGFAPWPGSACEAPAGSGRRLKLLALRVESGAGAPGEVLSVGAGDPVVATGAGALRLETVQPEGGRAMRGADYARGARWVPGLRLG